MAIIGIDLGTTNSLAAYWKDGKACLIPDAVGNVLFPSVVSFFAENEMAVGSVAKEQLLLQPDRTVASFKRYMGTDKTYPIGDKKYKPFELSAFVLSELKATAEHFLQEEIEEAVITVPAYFNDKQRSDTKKAAQLAGLHVERLINEPSAAALAYQMISGQTERNLVVFDFGGGTLDLSYVECFDNVIEIVAVAGDNLLGGDDVDACIYEYVCREKGLTKQDLTTEESAALHKEAEQKKCLLQQQEVVEIQGVELTNEKLFEICVPLFTRIKKVFLRLLEDAGVCISEIDDIIMVGGSSKLKVVSQFLTELLGKKPVVLGDTDLIVAMGAGAYAGIRQRAEGIKNLIMTDVCPFTLGVETFRSQEDKKGYMCVLIERNSTLPGKAKQKLYTMHDFQEQLQVKIYQGEEYYAEENLFLGDVMIQVPRKPAGKEWIEVEFVYDINGILQVEVVNSRGEKKHIQLANQELTKFELERYQTEMEAIVRMRSPWENKEYVQLFEKAEQYYEESVGNKREYLANVLGWYICQMNSGRLKTIKNTVEEMKQIIADLESYEETKEDMLFDGEQKKGALDDYNGDLERENDNSKGISYNKMYGFIKQIKEEYHITEEDLKIVEGKYDIKFPEILRSYYLEHNGDTIKTCYFLVDDYSYGIAKIVQLKKGTTTFEYIVDNDRKDGIIDENMFPIARNEGGDYYYWNKQTQNIYLYYCDDIENPVYICENINSFFEIMDKSCIV